MKEGIKDDDVSDLEKKGIEMKENCRNDKIPSLHWQTYLYIYATHAKKQTISSYESRGSYEWLWKVLLNVIHTGCLKVFLDSSYQESLKDVFKVNVSSIICLSNWLVIQSFISAKLLECFVLITTLEKSHTKLRMKVQQLKR